MKQEQLGKDKKTKKREDTKPVSLNKALTQPEQGTSMDRFNNAMRKILSVPKKQINKK